MSIFDMLVALSVTVAAPFLLAHLSSLQADLKPVPVRKRVFRSRR
jgi:hypothetical protein